jgi:hypothetical protein
LLLLKGVFLADKKTTRGEGRDLLIRAAADCFARNGRSAVTMRDVIAASGASVGTAYHHWFSSSFGGESAVREVDLDAGAAEVDHGDQGVGGVKAVGAV